VSSIKCDTTTGVYCKVSDQIDVGDEIEALVPFLPENSGALGAPQSHFESILPLKILLAAPRRKERC
jgi:hypothetical protein